jgi:hypothetical protein
MREMPFCVAEVQHYAEAYNKKYGHNTFAQSCMLLCWAVKPKLPTVFSVADGAVRPISESISLSDEPQNVGTHRNAEFYKLLNCKNI